MAEDSKTIFHELIYKFKQQRGKKIAYLTMSLAVFPPLEISDSRKTELLNVMNDI
ncbi:hypothetical protein NXX71_13575 [Bacteroides faecis]|nr:hypothetical protein [Bacteroides faecis]